MEHVNINEVRANLSQFVAKAAGGEPFIITRFGKPMAMLSPCASDTARVQRVGFLRGRIKVPDNFDTMGRDEIQRAFECEE